MGTVVWMFLAFSFKGASLIRETPRSYILHDFQIAVGYAGGQKLFMLRDHMVLILGFTFHGTSAHDSWIILVLRLPLALGLRKQYSKAIQ